MNQFFLSRLLILVTAAQSVTAKHHVEPSSAGSPKPSENITTSVIRRNTSDWHYYIDLEIGNPPQNASLLLDTGSSDTWISAPELCHNCSFSTYNVSASNSSLMIDKSAQFWEEYEPPDNVTGFYVSDTFNLPNTTIHNVSFGVVNTTVDGYRNPGGILGIGPDGSQTIAAQTGEPLWQPLDQLKAQGIINSLSYGIFLGGQYFWDPAPGEITFGGINPSRFSGSLLPLPLAPSPDQFPRLQVWLSSATLTVHRKKTHIILPPPNALGVSIGLDTGAPASYIPSSMFDQVASLLGANPRNGVVDCKYMFAKGGLTYTLYGFGGKYKDIEVSFKQLVGWQGAGECYLTIEPEKDCSRGSIRATCTALGADFLRAAYIYVNYDNLTVSIAQATYETAHEWPVGIEDFGSGSQKPLGVQRLA